MGCHFMSNVWRNTAVSIDTEDKMKWCREGEIYENQFVDFMTRYSHITLSINPEKKTNPLAPDLLVPGYGVCDLKSQRTPFFTANKYGIEPRDAITLNMKDVIRYRKLYPEIGIFFWINWQNNKVPNNRFKPIEYKWGVYFTSIKTILSFIDDGVAKTHEYERRKESTATKMKEWGMNSQKNAITSYVLDCNWLQPLISSKTDPWINSALI